ncbi:MAG TPA: FHA domain-containing protein [Gaiellaceae bacterium]|nr:FHA domain-containing protein [Gaiellaceae bacterium]
MALASIAVEELLLILKIAFVVLLYLFIWRIVRTASKELRLPQESFILAPSQAGDLAQLRDAVPRDGGRLVVVRSPTLAEGEERTLNSAPVTVGRGPQNDIALGGDDYASAKHARVEPRGDGVWVEDIGSTNGTFLNGIKLTRARKLTPGDVVRVGETELRYEA